MAPHPIEAKRAATTSSSSRKKTKTSEPEITSIIRAIDYLLEKDVEVDVFLMRKKKVDCSTDWQEKIERMKKTCAAHICKLADQYFEAATQEENVPSKPEISSKVQKQKVSAVPSDSASAGVLMGYRIEKVCCCQSLLTRTDWMSKYWADAILPTQSLTSRKASTSNFLRMK